MLPYLMYTTISITIIINISNNIIVPIAPPIIAVLLASIVTVLLLGAKQFGTYTILPVADVGYIITELDLLIVMLSSSSETDTETPNLVIIIWFSMGDFISNYHM